MSEEHPCEKDLRLPLSAFYELKNEKSGFADGTITVKVGKNRNFATDIVPYWANEKGILPGYMPLYAFRVSGETTSFELSGNIMIPKDATKLYLFAMNYDSREITRKPYVIDLPETAGFEEHSKPVIEFQVISDLHVGIDPTPLKRILHDIIEISPDSAGLFINGDITRCGDESEYQNFCETCLSVDNAPCYYVSIGNHDFYQAKAGRETRHRAVERFLKIARYPDNTRPDNQHYDFWLGGFHFVFLGDDATAGDYLSSAFNDSTMAWLRNTLNENKNAGRPVFLFHHQPIMGTVAGSNSDFDRARDSDKIVRRSLFTGLWGENAAKFRAVLKDFPEVILFSGHQHISLGYPATVKPGDRELPTVFNTASASQAATIRDHIKEKGNGSEGYYVYVYEDKIILRGRDFNTKKWIPSAQFCVNIKDFGE